MSQEKQNHDEHRQRQNELDAQQYELDQMEALYHSTAIEDAFRVGKTIGRVEKLCEQIERENDQQVT